MAGLIPAATDAPAPRPSTIELVRTRLEEAIDAKVAMRDDGVLSQAATVAEVLIAALGAGNKILLCGNGGSACDAAHLAAELTGRYAYDRPGLAAVCLADPVAAVTAIANDYSYADVFARQVAALGRRGDVLVVLTTSGRSRNVLAALEVARAGGLVTVALTGRSAPALDGLADHCLRVPAEETPRIQEMCLHLGHSICEIVESTLFPRPG